MRRDEVRGSRRSGGVLGLVLVTGWAVVAPGCVERPTKPVEPRTTVSIVEPLRQRQVDKIDLLLAIDNSRSMSDEQQILGLAIPDLVHALVNPRCIDATGAWAAQPADPLAACPEGSRREFEPILDIHIGVVTSSLGGHGSDACDAAEIPSEDDRGHLIDRVSTDGPATVPTWQGKRFLVWDPDGEAPTHQPQGETDVDELIANVSAMVLGAGEIGCGYESQLESWYRFLIEPDPHAKIVVQDGVAVLIGTDEQLLQQRRDFLRPDSLLAVIMMSDEDDCSLRDGGQSFWAAQTYTPGSSQPYHLPKARAACAEDPGSRCCRSCGEPPGEGCDDSHDDCDEPLSPLMDDINLRCFDQKRRFGIDFLWPIERYATGLMSTTVQDRHGNLVRNPIFADLDPGDDKSDLRDPSLVFLAGIVGVPWQDIARRDEDGRPDLEHGHDRHGKPLGGFQSARELVENGTWDVILGDPQGYVPPADPLMIASVEPRTGVNPITGDPLQPSGAGELANPINGHEHQNLARNDLQYACIYQLPKPRDCTDPSQASCECWSPNNDSPLCDPANPTMQKYAQAYPGIRELQVLREIGPQGVVASICPDQLDDPSRLSFGYRAAIGAIVERLKQQLGGKCLPRSLKPDAAGQVPCFVLEAKTLGDPSQCEAKCQALGRRPVAPEHRPAIDAAMADPASAKMGWNCFCELQQTSGSALEACQTSPGEPVIDAHGEGVHGWCYVDASTVPPTGDPEIVEACPDTEKRMIRLVGAADQAYASTLFITCGGA